jgi:protein-disulfide isomerase
MTSCSAAAIAAAAAASSVAMVRFWELLKLLYDSESLLFPDSDECAHECLAQECLFVASPGKLRENLK